jgi:hypothetical protein
VWVLSSASPTVLQRAASALPFYYWHANVGKNADRRPIDFIAVAAGPDKVGLLFKRHHRRGGATVERSPSGDSYRDRRRALRRTDLPVFAKASFPDSFCKSRRIRS